MIFDMPYINFSDEEWIYILIQYLNGWTEIPLNNSSGYNIDELKFYDGFIGLLLKRTEQYLMECPSSLNKSEIKFINSWKYQGKIYRIIHKNHTKNNKAKSGYSCKLPRVNYHGMISHWTDDYTFKGLLYRLSKREKYIILESDTQEHLGFDVNKFRKKYDCEKQYTKKEREIIFPMYKECIINEYHLTIEDFIKLKENSQQDIRK